MGTRRLRRRRRWEGGVVWPRPWPHQQLSWVFPPQGEALDLATISPDPRWVARSRSRTDALVQQQPDALGG